MYIAKIRCINTVYTFYAYTQVRQKLFVITKLHHFFKYLKYYLDERYDEKALREVKWFLQAVHIELQTCQQRSCVNEIPTTCCLQGFPQGG